MARSLAGTRIRQRRRTQKITQSALASAAGISPSYLNLIEHNRRGVAGRVLLGLARALKVAPSDITDGAEDTLLGELREIAARRPDLTPETYSTEEIVGRFPGWCRTMASLQRQSLDQDRVITALSDRLTHDPFLRESLHLMLSTVTAIHSTANILDTVGDVPEEQTKRFHANIHTESNRLSEAVERLVDYFDQASDEAGTAATPEEDLDRFLAFNDYQFPTLDAQAERDAQSPESDVAAQMEAKIDALLNKESATLRGPSVVLARSILRQYATDARQMPLAAFASAAISYSYEPATLATVFGCDLHAVFRRLATLRRPGIPAPTMGLIVVNAAGQALYRRPLPDFSLPRHGSACPLWPVFQSFSSPNATSVRAIELPNGRRFAALSVALSDEQSAFGSVPRVRSAMLVVADDEIPALQWLGSALPEQQKIGLNCRICPRKACPARAEPMILRPIGAA